MDRQTHRLSTKVLDMIIAHLIYDTTSLKAYAATCFAWYNVVTPYLHHTLIVREHHPKVARRGLDPLPVLDKLGLLPFVKKVQFKSDVSNKTWVKPQTFDSHSLRNFSALVGIQDLTIDGLDLQISRRGPKSTLATFRPRYGQSL